MSIVDERALEAARNFVLDHIQENPKSRGPDTRSIIEAYEQARRESVSQDRVERVARALCEQRHSSKSIPDEICSLTGEPWWRDFVEPAKVAIALLAADDAHDAEALVAKVRAERMPVVGVGTESFNDGLDTAISVIRKHFATPTTKE